LFPLVCGQDKTKRGGKQGPEPLAQLSSGDIQEGIGVNPDDLTDLLLACLEIVLPLLIDGDGVGIIPCIQSGIDEGVSPLHVPIHEFGALGVGHVVGG